MNRGALSRRHRYAGSRCSRPLYSEKGVEEILDSLMHGSWGGVASGVQRLALKNQGLSQLIGFLFDIETKKRLEFGEKFTGNINTAMMKLELIRKVTEDCLSCANPAIEINHDHESPKGWQVEVLSSKYSNSEGTNNASTKISFKARHGCAFVVSSR